MQADGGEESINQLERSIIRQQKSKVKRKSSSIEYKGEMKKLALVEDRPSTSSMDSVLMSPSFVSDDDDDEEMNPSPTVQHWLDTFQNLCTNDKMCALSLLISNCSISDLHHLRQTIDPYFQKDFIACLPKELAIYILSMLEAKDLVHAAQACKYWRTLTEDHLLWKEKCEESGFNLQTLPPAPRPQSNCWNRSPWKALFLRHYRINSNWRTSDKPIANQQVMKGHDEHVITCLQINGDKIVSGSDDNTLRVWSTSTGKCVHTLSGHTGGVWSSQMSSDGKMIISGSTDRSVRVWSTETGSCLHTLLGHTSTVRCMSLKDNILVSGSRDTTLRVWNIETGRLVHVLNGHVAAIRCVQFDGKRAVSGAYDYTVKIWDVETTECLHTLTGHTNRVYSLLFDSERNMVISGSLDTSIRVWETKDGACLHTLMGHHSLTSGMQLRGKTLVSGNADSTVKVWDIEKGKCLFTLEGPNKHQSAVTSLQYLESGLVVTSSDDGTVKLWDAKQGTFVRNLVQLESGGSGGCIWRLKAAPTSLVCAVGSRNGTEDTKLLLLDFNADYP